MLTARWSKPRLWSKLMVFTSFSSAQTASPVRSTTPHTPPQTISRAHTPKPKHPMHPYCRPAHRTRSCSRPAVWMSALVASTLCSTPILARPLILVRCMLVRSVSQGRRSISLNCLSTVLSLHCIEDSTMNENLIFMGIIIQQSKRLSYRQHKIKMRS